MNENQFSPRGQDSMKIRRALLERHKLHEGVYARVAKKLGTDPSYVSRVVAGSRKSLRIMDAVFVELERIERLKPSR